MAMLVLGRVAIRFSPSGENFKFYIQKIPLKGTLVRAHLNISHRIHGTGIFTCIYHTNQLNVGRYTSPMHGTGTVSL